MLTLAERLKLFTESNTTVSTNRDERVLFVDSLNSFLRCFAATPTLNDDGEHVGGLTGFLRSIAQAIRLIKPTRCVLIFDGRGGSVKRREIFSEYKENRKTMTRLNRTYDFDSKEQEHENQKRQLVNLVNVLTNLPVTVLAIDNVEADDVIGYLSNLVKDRGGTSFIMSSDKDFLQLIDDNTRVYNPVKKKIYNVDTVIEEYGIHPSNFMIYRTIDGDASDNIPGVNGVGRKTLLKNFPELATDVNIPWAHIYSRCEEILTGKKKNAACKLILESKDVIDRNMTLMRLDEQHIPGTIKIKVIEQFDAPINPLNKLTLTKMLVNYRLSGAFHDLDEWLTTSFISLTRFSKK